jgi:hypothetical protein
VGAWLIKRFLDPSAEIVAVPAGSEVPSDAGIAFDVPGGRWLRTPDRCVAEHVLAAMGRNDEALKKIVAMVRKLEVAYWMVESDSPAGQLQRSLMEIFERKADFSVRLEAAFKYLDGVYAAGGAVPTTSTMAAGPQN